MRRGERADTDTPGSPLEERSTKIVIVHEDRKPVLYDASGRPLARVMGFRPERRTATR